LEVLDYVIKFGAVPVLCILSYHLWVKVERQEAELQRINDDHKNDIRSSGDEAKSIQQNTLNTINDFNSTLSEAVIYIKKITKHD
tara:strand:+ start:16742 stop:16996 length:255 start_codon:yes stop_codon:yes gene_type:complete